MKYEESGLHPLFLPKPANNENTQQKGEDRRDSYRFSVDEGEVAVKIPYGADNFEVPTALDFWAICRDLMHISQGFSHVSNVPDELLFGKKQRTNIIKRSTAGRAAECERHQANHNSTRDPAYSSAYRPDGSSHCSCYLYCPCSYRDC